MNFWLDVDDYMKIPYNELPDPKRSYQSNIIKLVVGHFAAEHDLYNSFRILNDSNNKSKNISNIESITDCYIADVLVRYSGFHKIESQIDKTICSSNLKSIDLFKDYLDKGWNLQLIPAIIYDRYLDEIIEVDFNSYYVEKYLDKKLNEYNGKGKILIKK